MREPAMSERRKRSRAVTAQNAMIASRGAKRINCVVRNFSSTGARLELPSPTLVPETFDLVFDDSRAALACRVKWRKDRAIGVQFQLPHR
jgi:PilZ domain